MGFGFYGSSCSTESYFIFSDGSKSDLTTTTALNLFTENSIPGNTQIKRVSINHKNKNSGDPGQLLGIEIFDEKNISILKVGD